MVTLGPEGTDAEAEARRHFRRVLLAGSFELAVQAAITKGCHAMVAAGFAERHRPGGEVSDLWVDLHFRHLGEVELVGVWEAPTKPMCLAARPTVGRPRTLALHPATKAFADRYLPDAERRYVDAKPLAVQQVLDGCAEGCIGSVDVVRQAGLTVLCEFRPTMVWCLYQPVNLHIQSD
ncbi:hypothetical protein ACFQ6N_17980 [Kitasatospora sp. NPDC056446]|uniref:hypothetical protein n=1 Tax=Kitasatospora sp. NPDC056446 TaxID=3345819 RepID=UPI0036C4F5C6